LVDGIVLNADWLLVIFVLFQPVFKLLPKYLGMGFEDRTEDLRIGIVKKENTFLSSLGKAGDEVTISLWREVTPFCLSIILLFCLSVFRLSVVEFFCSSVFQSFCLSVFLSFCLYPACLFFCLFVS
jgi:hypothetical protein